MKKTLSKGLLLNATIAKGEGVNTERKDNRHRYLSCSWMFKTIYVSTCTSTYLSTVEKKRKKCGLVHNPSSKEPS